MKPVARIVIPPVSRRRHRTALHGVSLAALMGVTAAVGCSSESDDRPLLPCGVEERSSDGELFALIYRGYDERGNHVLSERDRGVDGTVDDRYVWQYAPGGGLAYSKIAFSNGSTREVTLEYGAGDELLAATWIDVFGTRGRADYEHLDDAGQVIERWDRDGDGTAEESVAYTYGPDGFLQESSVACNGAEEPVDIRTTMLRDEAGRIERIERWRDGELSGHREFSYNEDGLLESMRSWSGGTLALEETYEFDSSGNVRASTYGYATFNGQNPPPWYESRSVYDAEGRILRRDAFRNGEPDGTDTFLYECPGFEDSPGRSAGTPELAAPPEVMGPRGKAGPGEVSYYVDSVGSCPLDSAVSR